MTQEELGVVNAGVEKMLAEKTADIQAKFDNAVAANKSEFDKEIAAQKAQKETLVKSVGDLEAVVLKQGEVLAKRPFIGSSNEKSLELKAELKSFQENSVNGLQGEKVKLKAFTGDDAMSVGSIPNVAGTGVIAGALAGVVQYFSQVFDSIFSAPVATSNIMDYCEIVPLTGEQLVTISENRVINMSVTSEGVEKPVSKATYSATSTTAKPVPSMFKTTSQMRKFFIRFYNAFYKTLLMFFDKVIPERVIAEINLVATPFTPTPAQQIYTAPNIYDAIIQMISSLVKLGYKPNIAKISIASMAALQTMKASDGHYMLKNNGSINILDSTITFGDLIVKLDTDTSFADDDVLVADLTAVKIGLDNDVAYYEAYVDNDFKTNKKSHLVEKYLAVNVPTALRSGVMKDLLTNVKTLITKP